MSEQQFDFDIFEKATELMAYWLAEFREEGSQPTENDRLIAGHLAGSLAANNLLVIKPAKQLEPTSAFKVMADHFVEMGKKHSQS